MLSLPDAVRVFVARAPVDFRKAHDGLSQVVRDVFGDDPLSGHLFVFTNKRRDRIKLLFWDRNGLWLLYKRLERGTFPKFDLRGTKTGWKSIVRGSQCFWTDSFLRRRKFIRTMSDVCV